MRDCLRLHVTRYVTVTFPPYALQGHKLIPLEYAKLSKDGTRADLSFIHGYSATRFPSSASTGAGADRQGGVGTGAGAGFRAGADGNAASYAIDPGRGRWRRCRLGAGAWGGGSRWGRWQRCCLLRPRPPAHPAPEIRPPPAPAPPKIDVAHPPVIPKPAPTPAPRAPPRLVSVRARRAGRRAGCRWSAEGLGAGAEKAMSEAEIEPRTARAVEAEVTRRVQEGGARAWGGAGTREREKEKEKKAGSSRQHTESPKRTRERELPPGLTPLLKRHKDLDDELQSRLAELERKVENGNRDARLVDVLSPIWRKKTGRAYVALARSHSQQCVHLHRIMSSSEKGGYFLSCTSSCVASRRQRGDAIFEAGGMRWN
ncbi:hypothetical protein B0H14DRAFT_3506431 [Mycena olivaceomarginata]|nr:hypothetical protein B0H14DRAFT_3506431 [Mycena olivaceomarginata]